MVEPPTRRIALRGVDTATRRKRLAHEWLVTNGLGGYASGTIGGAATRRYHGLLVAALAAPLGRRMLLPHVDERLRLADGALVSLAHEHHLSEFRLEQGLPVWRYETHGLVLERRVLMPHEQNTVYVLYELIEGAAVRLKLRLAVHNRSHDAPVSTPLPDRLYVRECEQRYELAIGDLPPLRLVAYGRKQAFTVEHHELPELLYATEEARGYEHRGSLWSPGYFRVDLARAAPAALVASTESWETVAALAPEDALAAERERRRHRVAAAHSAAQAGLPAELVLAADQFLIRPAGRSKDAARLRAEGDEGRTVIAGYHWFTDWGRDTMISLEGLALLTGRHAEAASILRTFAHAIRDGLIPNLYPEGEDEGLYHTADATLWFFHAVSRYLEVTRDRSLLHGLLPKFVEIAEAHMRGTRFGIGADPEDGLLRQGAAGYQLTWMDAKVGDWVVTPRRGKAVEINALWYNALCLLARWLGECGRGGEAAVWQRHAERARASFNRRFWHAQGRYLHDVVDGENGDDSACRPNQIFAIALEHPVLDAEHWPAVLETVRERLLTSCGLRTLAPGHPDYRPQYYGDIRARDAAYHQGTVWPWLMGPFIDAWLKAHPADIETAHELVCTFDRHLGEACIGSISEICDAESPFTPRGCIAQAWSVAEVLRCLIKLDQRE